MDTLERVPVPTSEAWWAGLEEGSGYIDPRFLAPDLDQPRTHIRESELDDLYTSIAEKGVRDHLTVSPREKAPWVRIAPEDAHLPFAIVSGHRRRMVALQVGCATVPINIRVYANEAEYREDATILNAGHKDLTPLEQGWEAVRQRKLGTKIERIAASFVMAVPQLYARINLTRLAPDLQKRLAPELPPRQRLSIGTGGELGSVREPIVEELEEKLLLFKDIPEEETLLGQEIDDLDGDERRFVLQRLLLAVIIKRNLGYLQAEAFIREHKLSLKAHHNTGGRPTERFQPRRRRDILDNLLASLSGSVVLDWPAMEWARIFANASREEMDEVLAKFDEFAQNMGGIRTIIARIRDRKAPTNPEVERLMRRRM